MNEQYEQAVMERLSDRFGEVEGSDLASVLMETAKNAVEDNLPDYFSQLKAVSYTHLIRKRQSGLPCSTGIRATKEI